MKKLFVFVLALCLAEISFAQVQGGFKAGMNIAQLHLRYRSQTPRYETSDAAPGFLFGGFVTVKASNAISIQPELVFSRVGGKQEVPLADAGPDMETYKVDYVSVPVMVKLKIGNFFNIQAGPQVGILAQANIKTVASGGREHEEDIKHLFKSFDFGFNAGAGFTLKKFSLDIRYSVGITKAMNSYYFDATNNAAQISLGYQLFGK
jgi:Outer membrane protein beta-barrel domain